MAKKVRAHETADQLTERVPGLHQYRRQLILQLSAATSCNTHQFAPFEQAQRIVQVANGIIERTEQRQ